MTSQGCGNTEDLGEQAGVRREAAAHEARMAEAILCVLGREKKKLAAMEQELEERASLVRSLELELGRRREKLREHGGLE
jgi:hypothetical protein